MSINMGTKIRTGVNLYVGNLSSSMNHIWLRSIFHRFGSISFVFVSPRINTDGKKFGFVKFISYRDGVEALRRMMGQWVKDGNMVVNIARYEKKNFHAASRPLIDRSNINFIKRSSSHMSFREVVTREKLGDRRQGETPLARIQNDPEISMSHEKQDIELTENRGGRLVYDSGKYCKIAYTPSRSDIEWLNRSVVGYLKITNESIPMFEQFKAKGFHGAEIAMMGGSMALISFPSLERKKEIMELENNWFDEWFSKVTDWSPDCVCTDRFLRVKVDGIPLHGWNTNLFKAIGNQWGRFFSADAIACDYKRLDSVTIVVLTDLNRVIPSKMSIDIGGKLFDLKISVEGDFSPKIIDSDEDSEDDSDEDVSSSRHRVSMDGRNNVQNSVSSVCVSDDVSIPDNDKVKDPVSSYPSVQVVENSAEKDGSCGPIQDANFRVATNNDSGSKYLEVGGELRKGYFLRKPKIKHMVVSEIVKEGAKLKGKVNVKKKTLSRINSSANLEMLNESLCPLKEAEKTWELGKLLGFEALAPEAEIIQSLV